MRGHTASWRSTGSIILPPWWRRRAGGLLALLAVAVVAVCDRSLQGPTHGGDETRYHDRSFQVTYVVDGDTLDINAPDADQPTTRVRLWGVDTPEIGHGREPDMHFGPEAKAFAEQTLAGRDVHLVLSPKRTRDKYGRLLAYVFLERGGTMFNEMLLEQGYAYADLRFDHHYDARFEGIEKRARKAGVGLWANVRVGDMPEWRQKRESPKEPMNEP